MEFNRCYPYNSSVMSSGEKYKMVSSTNQLFIQLLNNLQQVKIENLSYIKTFSELHMRLTFSLFHPCIVDQE